VTDLTPVEGMTELHLLMFSPSKITKGIETVRAMKGLRLLGESYTLTPEEFWEKYDAGEFHKKAKK